MDEGQTLIGLALTLAIALDPPAIRLVETPTQAAVMAAWDRSQLAPLDQIHVRYVWVPPWGDSTWHYALSFSVNTAISRAGTIQHPRIVAGTLQRWDLRELVPDEAVRRTVAAEWDRIAAEDPYFRRSGVFHPPIHAALALFAFAPLPPADLSIVRADRFLAQSLSAIEGRYLELRGLADLKSTDGRSPEELALARFGVFESQAIAGDHDSRVGMFFSEVTAKPRSVLFVRGLGGSAWITEDLFDRDVDASRHPIYHLLKSAPRGHEIIAEMRNGLHVFLVTDDRGQILREAPAELVTDSRIPRPHTARLDAGPISCVRCHSDGGGLRDCANDVATLLATSVEVLAEGDLGPEQSADAIATRYAGTEFERHLERGRLDYASAVDQITGGELTVAQLSELVATIFSGYRYRTIDARQIALELGFELSDEAAPIATFRELLPTPAALPGLSVTEDPTVAAVAAGVPIRRADLERVFGEMLIRSEVWRNTRERAEEPPTPPRAAAPIPRREAIETGSLAA